MASVWSACPQIPLYCLQAQCNDNSGTSAAEAAALSEDNGADASSAASLPLLFVGAVVAALATLGLW